MITEEKDIVNEQNIPDGANRITLPDKNRHLVVRDYQNEIYGDIIGTVVRETVTNAIDAHDEAGTDRSVMVSINDGTYLGDSTPMFVVEDFGVGMDHSFMMNEFVQYRTTTKNDTNELRGGYGIGAKSPLGYRDTFLMDSFWNGTRRRYMLQRHQDGDYIVPVDEEETSRTNGVRVMVPIEEQDIDDFKHACTEQLCYMAPQIDFQDQAPPVELPEATFETEHIRLAEKTISTHDSGYRSVWDSLHIVMGDVPYELDVNQIGDLDYQASRVGGTTALKFGVGELDLNLSREQIRYTKRTRRKIKEKLNDEIVPDLNQRIASVLNDYEPDSYIEKQLQAHSMKRYKNFDSVKDQLQEAIAAIRLRNRLVSDAGGGSSHRSADFGDGTPYVLEKSGRSYDLNELNNTAYFLDKAMQGEKTPVFWATINSDAPRNRYLAQKYGKCWVFFFDTAAGDFFDEFTELFDSYDDLTERDDFERKDYQHAHDDDEIPAYRPKKYRQKLTRHYEDIADIKDPTSDTIWVYGYVDDQQRLLNFRDEVAPRVGLPSRRYKLRRVSKANGKKHFTRDNHVYIRDIDVKDERENNKAFYVQQYKLLEIREEHEWMSMFDQTEDTKPLARLWEHVDHACEPIKSEGFLHPDDSSRQPSNKWKADVRSWYGDAPDTYKELPPQLSQIVTRLRHYSERLYTLKPALSSYGFRERYQDSALKMLHTTLQRMSDVPEVGAPDFDLRQQQEKMSALERLGLGHLE